MSSTRTQATIGHLISPHDQSADFVELFFDLVFVFAITKVTHLTAHNLDAYGVLRSALIFWLIWWGWCQFTWTLNAADTSHPQVKLVTLLATAVAFVMAASADHAFSGGVLWFAVPYVVVRVMGMGLMFWVAPTDEGEQAAVALMAALSVIGLGAVLIGAFASPSARIGWWLVAVIGEFITAFVAGRAQGWNLRVAHFAERHALIVIIALGESLIVAASAVSGAERSPELLRTGGLAVLITCLLWWSYFGWIRERMEDRLEEAAAEDRPRLGRDVYSFSHFPLICGIIGVAVGFQRILSQPGAALTAPVAAALGGGVLLIVGATGIAIWRASHTFLAPRMIILITSVAATAFTVGRPPAIALGLLAVGLTAVNTMEWKYCRKLIPLSGEITANEP